MIKNYNVLLVDDHPIIISAYKQVFKKVESQNSDLGFKIYEANNFIEALNHLKRFNQKRKLHLLLVDLKLAPAPNHNLLSGEDLALQVKESFTEVKIMIATTYHHNYRIHSIFKSLNPEGFLVKGDIDEKEIENAIIDLLNDTPYYSKTVRNALRQYVSNDLLLDRLDRQILYELSQGTKTKDLSNILPLSSAGIDRRKKRLKEILDVIENDDKTLLQKAKDLGFL